MIQNYQQADQALSSYASTRSSGKYTLDRMRKLMKFLGNPQNQLKIIHVAGTSGKTSTSYYIASLLKAAGKKIGLSVSPHVDYVSERAQIDLKCLPEKQYCQLLDQYLKLVEDSKLKPSYFEVLIAFAYWLFERQAVDYAVIEVGIGGLLDSSNVANRQDKVCIITDIGLDHISILGSTKKEITYQKAGIITKHNTVLIHEQAEEIIDTVRSVVGQQAGSLITVTDNLMDSSKTNVSNLFGSEIPLFQLRNFSLAIASYKYITERDSLIALSQSAIEYCARTRIPGRMEIRKQDGKTIILDGSHNQQKLAALTRSIKASFPEKRIGLLVYLKRDMLNNPKSLSQLRKITKTITLTSLDHNNDQQSQSTRLDQQLELCKTAGFEKIKVETNPTSAFKLALQSDIDVIVITGSFYLLNRIRPLL